jgi:hypothetical protein
MTVLELWVRYQAVTSACVLWIGILADPESSASVGDDITAPVRGAAAVLVRSDAVLDTAVVPLMGIGVSSCISAPWPALALARLWPRIVVCNAAGSPGGTRRQSLPASVKFRTLSAASQATACRL